MSSLYPTLTNHWTDDLIAEYSVFQHQPPYPYGISALDEETWGLHPQRIIVIGARPGEGKTALSLNIAWNLAKVGKRVVYFTLEMTKEELFVRICCRELNLDATKFQRHQVLPEELRKIKEFVSGFDKCPIDFQDSSGYVFPDIMTYLNNNPEIEIVFIDYIQMIHGGYDERIAFQEYVRGLKEYAKTNKKIIVLVSQINRESAFRTDPRPQLSDLKGSGAIEEVADVVLLLYREWRYKQKVDKRSQGGELLEKSNYNDFEIIIAKHRHGKDYAKIKLLYIPHLYQFREIKGE